MFALFENLWQNNPTHIDLNQLPEGMEAIALSSLFQQTKKSLLVVLHHKERMEELTQQLRALDPHLPLLSFPAWDTLAYDRVSPRRDLMGKRLSTLYEISISQKPFILLATCSSLLQRIPPKSLFQDTVLTLHIGQILAEGDLEKTLIKAGYFRVETVREPGEYALRGSLVDLFPAHSPLPYRIDRFGSQIDSLRTFDPLSQRTLESVAKVNILPVSEVCLSSESISLFRARYREAFGVPKTNDLLYHALSQEHAYNGMEHWLPFFYENLTTLTDLLPKGSLVCMTKDVPLILEERWHTLKDHYDARVQNLGGKDILYNPVPLESLFVPLNQLQEALENHVQICLTPFEQPEISGHTSLQAGGKSLLWPQEAFSKTALERLQDLFIQAKASSKTLLLTWHLEREKQTLQEMLRALNHPFQEIDASQLFTRSDLQIPALAFYPLAQSFEDAERLVVSASHLLGKLVTRPVRRKRRSDLFIEEACALTTGDLVVHQEHGVGQYKGLVSVTVSGIPHDCLHLEYAGQDRLLLPVENLDMICRYGGEGSNASLDKLGSQTWQKRREKVKKDLFAIASHLLEVAAARELLTCEPMDPDTQVYPAFCNRFAYTETDDQLRTLEETLEDLASGHPMDRLVCGDVGFGKTEIALRTACLVAANGRQVALIAPTTLLARQHFQNFTQRFKGLGIRVAQLSRFVSAKNAKQTKLDLAAGKIDIVIATHALLSKSVTFQDLGLMIVDEEQHFGVKQKEKLKSLYPSVHLLTLSATPIPRTLQMALTGMRSLSLITTPPIDRLSVRTFVTPFDGVVIKEAILRERARSGQVFFVCPRLKDMEEVRQTLLTLIPDLRITVATGQMAAIDLEDAMVAFCDRQFDVLLSTNIIESGLDLPFVNTIIIYRADLFGLSQLYQLRGRVGRAKLRGYAYFTTPTHKLISPTATKRLEILQTLDTLGAGFQLASHDMDLRGTGNLLGQEQSGHIREVGLELYQQMLEEAVLAVKASAAGETIEEKWSPQMSLGLPVVLPASYIPDLGVRMNFYRRLSWAKSTQDLEDLKNEAQDRFGPLTTEASTLFSVMALKQACKRVGVSKIDIGDKGLSLTFYNQSFGNPSALISYVLSKKGALSVRPDQSLVIKADLREPQLKLKIATKILKDLEALLKKEEST